MNADDISSILDLLALPLPDFVEAAHLVVLERSPNALEIAECSALLRSGSGRHRLLASLRETAECARNREQWLHGPDNETFVNAVFQRYLGRTPDPKGLKYYLNALSRGEGRKKICKDVAESREARSRRTLWFELDQLFTEARNESHMLLRWFGRAGRRRRFRNQLIELIIRDQKTQKLPVPDSHVQPGQDLPIRRAHLADPNVLGRTARQALVWIQRAGGNG